MNHVRKFLAVGVLSLLLLAPALPASAATTAELQAQLSTLIQIVQQLQAQLLALQASANSSTSSTAGVSTSLNVSSFTGTVPFSVTATARTKNDTYACGAVSFGTISWGDGASESLVREAQSGSCGTEAIDSISHTYTRTGTYSIVFTNTSGITQSQTVTAGNTTTTTGTTQTTSSTAPTCSLSASPSTTAPNQSVRLSWTSQNATSASLSQGYGTVSPNSAGYLSFSQTGSNTATLTVTGPGGSSSCSTNVIVQSGGSTTTSGSTNTSSTASTATYQVYMYGVLVRTQYSVTQAAALTDCQATARTSPDATLRCVWNGGDIYTHTAPGATVGRPDLTATVSGPTTASVGQSVSVSGTITNQGNGTTGTSFPAVFVTNLNSGRTDWITKNVVNLITLAGGQSASVNTTFSWSTPGTYEYALCADSSTLWAGTVAETDETNNCSTHTTIVVGNSTPVNGTYQLYVNGAASNTVMNISQSESLSNCQLTAANNPSASVRCYWNGTQIYSR